jgi:hypothetical protein
VFPASDAALTIGAGALVRAAGGVKLTGSLGTASIYLGGVTDASDMASVEASDTLTTGGNILGSGTMTVKGSLVFKSRTINPTLDIQGTGTFGGGGNCNIQGTLFTGARLGLSMASNLVLDNPSGLIKFGQITQCSANSVITLRVRSIAQIQGGTYTAMSYSTSTSTTVLNCNIELRDDAGNVLPLMRKAVTASGARRLLQSEGGQYNWNDGKLEYTIAGRTNAAATVEISFVALLIALVLAFLA